MAPFKKYINGELCKASGVYNGYCSDSVFVMFFDDNKWFQAEVKAFELLADKPYIPELIDVNQESKQISFKWYNSNLNHLFHFNKKLPSDYSKQIKEILEDLEQSGIYKLNIYPHTFYLKDSKIHIMDLHACVHKDSVILENDLGDVINDTNRFKFNNGVLDLTHTYNYTIKHNIGNWPGDFLNA